MATTSTHDDADAPPKMDYPSHRRQYNRFLHLVKWSVIHFALLVPALYFFIIAGQGIVGTVMLILAVVALGYGVMSTSGIADDIDDTLESVSTPHQMGD